MSRWIVIDADVIPNIYTATHQELIFALEDSLGASTEIIHCRECKWGSDKQTGEAVYCEWHGFPWNVNGFCSYGERSER